MQLVSFPLAGSGGRMVLLNPLQVVCVVDVGDGRSQIVTTGLSGESSMSLVVDQEPREVARRLGSKAEEPVR